MLVAAETIVIDSSKHYELRLVQTRTVIRPCKIRNRPIRYNLTPSLAHQIKNNNITQNTIRLILSSMYKQILLPFIIAHNMGMPCLWGLSICLHVLPVNLLPPQKLMVYFEILQSVCQRGVLVHASEDVHSLDGVFCFIVGLG